MNREKLIWHISDTHGKHNFIKSPCNIEDIDIVIFSGDEANPRDVYTNEMQSLDFLEWFSQLDIPIKIFVAGNHSTAIAAGLITKQKIESKGIIYLHNESVEIDGLKIWGSPYTPSFGVGWAYNMKRHKLHTLWATIPDDTDVIVTHGPPKGVLDLAYHKVDNKWLLEYCGCAALLKRIYEVNPKLCCFGHIHDNEDNLNYGTRTITFLNTIFSNGAVVTDGEFNKFPRQGNLINLQYNV